VIRYRKACRCSVFFVAVVVADAKLIRYGDSLRAIADSLQAVLD